MKFQHSDQVDQLLERRFESLMDTDQGQNLSLDMHMDLMVAFHDLDSFDPETFKSYALGDILTYLEATHRYYLSDALKKIRFAIDDLTTKKPELRDLQIALHQFFNFFEKDLIEHIDHEEKDLFPYIKTLLKIQEGEPQKINVKDKLALIEFLIDHDNQCEHVLEELMNYLESRLVNYPNFLSLPILLNRLHFFMRDLKVHSLIEEEVLIPVAINVEKSVLRDYQE